MFHHSVCKTCMKKKLSLLINKVTHTIYALFMLDSIVLNRELHNIWVLEWNAIWNGGVFCLLIHPSCFLLSHLFSLRFFNSACPNFIPDNSVKSTSLLCVYFISSFKICLEMPMPEDIYIFMERLSQNLATRLRYGASEACVKGWCK